ncbi:MAG: NAD-dependent epimerase/dehydratase family protein [Polyangiales bacterium]
MRPRAEVVVTGGAGFVGASLALGLAERHPDWQIRAFDNLKRRGSELALTRLARRGVRFVHGDVRNVADVRDLGRFDLLIDCAAEPSVLADSPSYVLDTNLNGTLHCLEAARTHDAGFVFLSTSRVYPITRLTQVPRIEQSTRFAIAPHASGAGLSAHGIAEDFPLAGARSLYGASKLASELIIEEYAAAYGLRAVIDRCGVLAGPWQMGKVDQGVIVHWVASHVFQRPLRYIGWGGSGKQLRDVLHVQDLIRLVDSQITVLDQLHADVFNVGGGATGSLSLYELTELCQMATGQRVELGSEPETRRADIPLYVSDARLASQRFDWAPQHAPAQIVEDIARWIHDERAALERIFT